MTEKEIKQMQAEIERLKAENERLHSEMIRLVSRNLDLSERLEADVELRRRTQVARMLMEENMERLRNADLQDDSQLMAILDLLKVAKSKGSKCTLTGLNDEIYEVFDEVGFINLFDIIKAP